MLLWLLLSMTRFSITRMGKISRVGDKYQDRNNAILWDLNDYSTSDLLFLETFDDVSDLVEVKHFNFRDYCTFQRMLQKVFHLLFCSYHDASNCKIYALSAPYCLVSGYVILTSSGADGSRKRNIKVIPRKSNRDNDSHIPHQIRSLHKRFL